MVSQSASRLAWARFLGVPAEVHAEVDRLMPFSLAASECSP
jgi:hypothetical protein